MSLARRARRQPAAAARPARRARGARRRRARRRRPSSAIEDAAVREVVALQERAGLEVLTDGELRRESFQSELTEAVDGVEGAGLDAWLWGDWHSGEVGDRSLARPAGLAVTAPLRRRRQLAAEEFTFMRAATDRLVKVTLPSPTLFANLWDPERSRAAYPRFDDFIDRRRRDPGRRGPRARAPRLPLRPARRAPLPAADRAALARLLRAARLVAGALAVLWRRARQRRHRGRPDGRVRLPSLPRQPGLALARRGRLRRDRGADLRLASPRGGCCSSTTTSAPAASMRSPACPRTGSSCSAS